MTHHAQDRYGPATPPDAGQADTDASETLAGQLRSLSRGVVDRELERLARKVPSLSEEDLALVTVALHDLVERTLVARASGLPHREAQLRDLFGLATSA